jgi:hypothetical protein
MLYYVIVFIKYRIILFANIENINKILVEIFSKILIN